MCAAQDGGDCDQNGVACSHAHGKHVNSLSADCDCDGVVLAQLDACHSCTTIDQDRNNDGVNHNTSDVILQSIPSQQNVKENESGDDSVVAEDCDEDEDKNMEKVYLPGKEDFLHVESEFSHGGDKANVNYKMAGGSKRKREYSDDELVYIAKMLHNRDFNQFLLSKKVLN